MGPFCVQEAEIVIARSHREFGQAHDCVELRRYRIFLAFHREISRCAVCAFGVMKLAKV